MGAFSDQFIRLLHESPPPGQFLLLLYGGPLGSISSLTIWGPPHINLFTNYVGPPSSQFLCLLYGGPLRSISLLTMWGPPQVSFFAYYMGAPQINFFAYYVGTPLDKFLCILYGPPEVSFFAYYKGPLRSVSSHTIWGPPQISFFRILHGVPQTCFFAYYMGAPSDQFLCLQQSIWAPPPPRSVSLLTISGPLDLFFYFYALNWGGGGKCPLLPLPVCGRPFMRSLCPML